ncbi:hypothetical protein N9230_02090 [Akkermansiaceae bacterium]|nr:hypothetical protein [Akkermansiaceae bacterium]
MGNRCVFGIRLVALLLASSGMLHAETLNIAKLKNYANQAIPAFVTKDNSAHYTLTDEGATLGRVLFYDKKLSTTNTVSCASCHRQESGFSDSAAKSVGVGGETPRHAMRLINIRYASETNYFWDERAASLEEQTTQPIKDHIEMGYSGLDGHPDIDDLIAKLEGLDYYPPLFDLAFGDPAITESRMQLALGQFVRSIQSFDSKYDVGRAQVATNLDELPNFTHEENLGRYLFVEEMDIVTGEAEVPGPDGPVTMTVALRLGGGMGCASCHQPPEFDIDPESLNNGNSLGVGGAHDYSVTRSPSLRNIFNPAGELNGPLFHNGAVTEVDGIMAHYNFQEIDPENTNLDPRLTLEGLPLFLDVAPYEERQILAFLRTLSGSDVYTNEKWSDPFDASGNLVLSNELRIDALYYSASAGEVSFELSSRPGATYTLWTSSDLSADGWSVFQSGIQADSASFRTLVGPFPVSDSRRSYFRVSEEVP